ncbi:hypothetical protein EQM14_11150 [Caproiciproducens sp. NJN-50]|uniref:DUF6020 family protein n=1 Tax=Acutalibacteraceae TaxID=3082771 RepID=UPI000FFDFEB1|nr:MULTISPECIES: DUF6020 family protein [Acutalibacteraceae]QAT50272.1 hypothetical protein EQM14_11150 [Caproiciproducens sp. NJN-50]
MFKLRAAGKELFCMAASFLSVTSLTYVLKTRNDPLLINNSVLSAVFFLAFAVLFYKGANLARRRLLLCSAAPGLVLGSMLVVGSEVDQTGRLSLRSPHLYLASAGAALLLTVLIELLFVKMEKSLSVPPRFPMAGTRSFLLQWALIFLCWLPCFFAIYPGVYAYDGPIQLAQSLANDHVLVAQHPIVHTLYLDACFSAGLRFFGTNNAGMAIYSISQMLILSAALSFCCRVLARRGAPLVLRAAALLYFALFPMNPVLAMSTTKDTPFAAALLVFILAVWDLSENPGAFFSSPLRPFLFFLSACAMFLLRNNGAYLFALSIPVWILLLRGHRVGISLLCAACLAFYAVFTGPVYSLLHVIPGDFHEALSIPAQQLARSVIDHGDELTPDELQTVFRMIPEKQLRGYAPRFADPVKNAFQTKYVLNNKKKCLNTWISIGLKCPDSYTNAFLCNSLGFWDPDVDYQSGWAQNPFPYVEFQNKPNLPPDWFPVTRHSFLPGLDRFYESVATGRAVDRVPVLSLLISPALPFWVLAWSTAFCVFRKQYSSLIALAPLFAFWITLLLSPVVLLRYAFPFQICMPVMTALALRPKRGLNDQPNPQAGTL